MKFIFYNIQFKQLGFKHVSGQLGGRPLSKGWPQAEPFWARWATLWLFIVLMPMPALPAAINKCSDIFAVTRQPISAREIISIWHRALDPNFNHEQLTTRDREILGELGFSQDALSRAGSGLSKRILHKAQHSRLVDQNELSSESEAYARRSLPQVAVSLKSVNLTDSSHRSGRSDRMDLIRGFGFLLLPRWDKAFDGGEYLTNSVRQRGQTATGYPKFDPSSAHHRFSVAFRKLSKGLDHEVRPVAHTLTGSDANNLFLDIARWVATIRNGKPTEGKIFVFSDSYGAARGSLREFRFFDRDQTKNDLSIPSPVTHIPPHRQDPKAPLTQAEIKSLITIEERFRSRNDIGGILVEPVLTAKGVYFYTHSFLRELRILADRLEIPLLADEVFNAGGRTGKAFSYLHYQGFVPDFVTYGKGIGAAGLAEVVHQNRENKFNVSHLEKIIAEKRGQFGLFVDLPLIGSSEYPYKMFDTTVVNTAEQMLKASTIIDRIVDDKLIDRAREIGEYFELRNRWFKLKMFRSNIGYYNESNRFLGLLIGLTSENRYAPVLTITKSDIDFLYRQRTNEYLSEQIGRCIEYLRRYRGDEKETLQRLEKAQEMLIQFTRVSNETFFEKAPSIVDLIADQLPNYGGPPRLTYQTSNDR